MRRSTNWISEMAAVMRQTGAVQACRRVVRKSGEVEEWSLTLGPEPLQKTFPILSAPRAGSVESTDDPELLSREQKRSAYYELLNQTLSDDELDRLPSLPYTVS